MHEIRLQKHKSISRTFSNLALGVERKAAADTIEMKYFLLHAAALTQLSVKELRRRYPLARKLKIIFHVRESSIVATGFD